MKLIVSATTLAVVSANQLVRFDNPKFLLTGVFEDNDFDAGIVFDQFMSGRWCQTLDDFSYPLENDDWTYLQNKPVEKWCKMWRLCRIETKRNEITCNQVNYRNPKSRAVNNQKGFFANTKMLAYSADRVNFNDPLHLQSKVLAGHVCTTEYNETPCLKKTCNCDLQLADKVLDHVVEHYKNEYAENKPEELEEQAASVIEVEQPVENLNDKVEEIVADHAMLVEEHTKLVEDIAAFKHKVQDVVEQHAKSSLTDLKDSLAPVDESLAAEEEIFEESTETVVHAIEALTQTEGKENEDLTDEEAHNNLMRVVVEAEAKANNMGDSANSMIDDIAAFNQDFVFEGAIKK